MNTPEAGPALEPYDEAFAAPGEPRPHVAALLHALDGRGLAALRDPVRARVRPVLGDLRAHVVTPRSGRAPVVFAAGVNSRSYRGASPA